jgi:hypothetical protein
LPADIGQRPPCKEKQLVLVAKLYSEKFFYFVLSKYSTKIDDDTIENSSPTSLNLGSASTPLVV